MRVCENCDDLPLSDTEAHLVVYEEPWFIPRGKISAVLVFFIALMVLFIICAPIIKEIS